MGMQIRKHDRFPIRLIRNSAKVRERSFRWTRLTFDLWQKITYNHTLQCQQLFTYSYHMCFNWELTEPSNQSCHQQNVESRYHQIWSTNMTPKRVSPLRLTTWASVWYWSALLVNGTADWHGPLWNQFITDNNWMSKHVIITNCAITKWLLICQHRPLLLAHLNLTCYTNRTDFKVLDTFHGMPNSNKSSAIKDTNNA